MLTLTPQLFLNHLARSAPNSEFLGSLDQAILRHCIDEGSMAASFDDLAPVVRDASFALVRDFLRRIPGSMTARLFGPDRLQEPIQEPLSGGRSLLDGLLSHEEFVVEVRCDSAGFHDPETLLPPPGNLEIALRDIEEGLQRFSHLVLLGGLDGGGSWEPNRNRTMAFRLASPGLLLSELRKKNPQAGSNALYAGGLVAFRQYERALSVSSWPVGIPLDRQPVDAEGPQHPLYFLLHELGHAAIRSLRSPSLKGAGLALLHAGLAVFPEVDGVSPQDRKGAVLSRFFGNTIELRRHYFAEQLAESLQETTSGYLDCHPSLADVRRYGEFLSEAEGALRVALLDFPEASWDSLWESLRQSECLVQKHLEFCESLR